MSHGSIIISIQELESDNSTVLISISVYQISIFYLIEKLNVFENFPCKFRFAIRNYQVKNYPIRAALLCVNY